MRIEKLSSFTIAGIIVVFIILIISALLFSLNIPFNSSVLLIIFVTGTLVFECLIFHENPIASLFFFILFIIFFSIILADILNGIVVGSMATVLLSILINFRYSG